MSGEGRPKNLGEMGNNRDIFCYANRGSQSRKRISTITSWHQNHCDASVFLHTRSNFRGKKNKKLDFHSKI